jgi:hypothetical protein
MVQEPKIICSQRVDKKDVPKDVLKKTEKRGTTQFPKKRTKGKKKTAQVGLPEPCQLRRNRINLCLSLSLTRVKLREQ